MAFRLRAPSPMRPRWSARSTAGSTRATVTLRSRRNRAASPGSALATRSKAGGLMPPSCSASRHTTRTSGLRPAPPTSSALSAFRDMTRIIKAHAYGNDFLLAPLEDAHRGGVDVARFARAMCDRHRGVGADGLILYELRERGAAMDLRNADGSASELSGNGLRCLAALVARAQNLAPGTTVTAETGAGPKSLELLSVEGTQYTFRAALGQPTNLREITIPVLGESVRATTLGMGNPQCVVLGALPEAERFNRLGPALSTHAMFPEGTNVEFAEIEAADRVRIMIWERGVGPTMSSGTGSSASAVAAAAHGGASRDVQVDAPGGIQRVEWRDDGVYLTGWAELVAEGTWLIAR